MSLLVDFHESLYDFLSSFRYSFSNLRAYGVPSLKHQEDPIRDFPKMVP